MKVNILKYLHNHRKQVKHCCLPNTYREWKEAMLTLYARYMDMEEQYLDYVTFGYTDGTFRVRNIITQREEKDK